MSLAHVPDELVGHADGSAYLRFAQSPWVAYVSAAGELRNLATRASLERVHRIARAPDGTLLAFSTTDVAPPGIEVQRFDANGTELGSGRWSDPQAQLGVSAVATRGLDVVAVTRTAAGFLLGRVLGDHNISTFATIDFTAPKDPFRTGELYYPRQPSSVALGAGGEIYLAGGLYSPPNAMWRAVVEANGTPRVEAVLESPIERFVSPLLAAGRAGEIYHTWTHYLRGVDSAHIARLSGTLGVIWTQSRFDKYESYVADALAPLADSLVVSVWHGGESSLQRLNPDGGFSADSVSVGGATRLAAAAGDYDVLVVSCDGSCVLSKFSFPPLRAGAP